MYNILTYQFIYVSLRAAQTRGHIFMGFIKGVHIFLNVNFEALGLNNNTYFI